TDAGRAHRREDLGAHLGLGDLGAWGAWRGGCSGALLGAGRRLAGPLPERQLAVVRVATAAAEAEAAAAARHVLLHPVEHRLRQASGGERVEQRLGTARGLDAVALLRRRQRGGRRRLATEAPVDAVDSRRHGGAERLQRVAADTGDDELGAGARRATTASRATAAGGTAATSRRAVACGHRAAGVAAARCRGGRATGARRHAVGELGAV